MTTGPWAGFTADQIGEQLDKQRAVLSELEIPWRDRQPFLQSRGYTLRPRYRPGWVASWTLDTSLDPPLCEDYITHPVST